MKKLFIIILLGLFISGLSCCAKETIAGEKGLYVHTYDTKAFDEYVNENFSAHLSVMYGSVDETFKIGKGIWVYGNDIPAVVYPILKDDEIVQSFAVVKYNDVYSGSLGGGSAQSLNYAIGKTDIDHPLRLYKNDNGYYYIIDEGIYEMKNPTNKINNFALEIEVFTSFVLDTSKIINIFD